MKSKYIGFILALTISLLSFYANLPVAGPMIQSDESCYLLNAAAIAGYPNDFGNSHHAGYSIILAPAYWFGNSPQSIWFWVKIINSFLVFSNVLLLWWISYLLAPAIPLLRRAFSVFVVGIYPAIIVLAGYSFAQIAFAPCFLAVVAHLLLALSSSPRGTMIPWIASGFFAGYAYCPNPDDHL